MVSINGTGCCLIDYLYPNVDFSAPAFKAALSKKDGDGGLGIGKLVFAEHFETFMGRPYDTVLKELSGGKPSYNLGGPSIVSLVHAAQVLGDTAQVGFFGARGSDATGGLVEAALGRAGFSGGLSDKHARYCLARIEGPTPRTDVLSDPRYDNGHGERTFINVIGAAGLYESGFLTSGVLQGENSPPSDEFFNADIVAFGGTALTPRIHDNLTGLLEKAKQKKAFTLVNLVFDYRSEQTSPGKKWKLGKNDDAYPRIDLLIADKDEAWRTSGCPSPGDALRWFLEKGCGAAIITEGSRAVHFASGRAPFTVFKPQTLPVSGAIDRELAAHPEKRGDTTGCGDNFAGGVIAGIAGQLEERGPEELDIREACVPGIAAGGFACFTLGGVFYEKQSGEKAKLLEPFIEAYRKEQFSVLK
ncbi:MAG: carbohydrate kinase family protein [Treponema sp.]|nr:carbohydrate kinase family protein [Treponema sp.]